MQGKLTLTLTDAATQTQRVLTEQDVQLQPAEGKQITLKIPADTVTTDASAVRFFRVQAQFVASEKLTSSSSCTFMTIQPTNPLRPISDIHPANGAQLNFIVTRGFRTAFSIGTGTREAPALGEPRTTTFGPMHASSSRPARARTTLPNSSS